MESGARREKRWIEAAEVCSALGVFLQVEMAHKSLSPHPSVKDQSLSNICMFLRLPFSKLSKQQNSYTSQVKDMHLVISRYSESFLYYGGHR